MKTLLQRSQGLSRPFSSVFSVDRPHVSEQLQSVRPVPTGVLIRGPRVALSKKIIHMIDMLRDHLEQGKPQTNRLTVDVRVFSRFVFSNR